MALSVHTDYRLFELEQSIFPGKALFFNQVRLMFFLFLQENIYCWYSLEVPLRGTSNEYHNICFSGEIRKKYLSGYSFYLELCRMCLHTTGDRLYFLWSKWCLKRSCCDIGLLFSK